MTAGMCVPLVVLLSVFMLHSVSAGGLYCAKTARARAAALGLDYPGVHGAPEFSGPAHHEVHPDTMPLRPRPYEGSDPYLDEGEPNVASDGHNQRQVGSFDDGARQQAHPRSSESTSLLSHGAYNPVQSEYTSFPRGQTDSNHNSNFEEVKHVAPPTLFQASGQPDLANWDPQGRGESLSFVYNKHNLVFDESAPNRRGMSLSGLPLPRSRGHGTYHRGLTGFGPSREVPVLASSRFPSKGHVRAMISRSPAFGRRGKIRLPDHRLRSLHRNLDVKQFVQGNPALRLG
ncbi:uncharacterized protein LOC118113388 [Hippoglossus stenolepis]|uniref:uncharacterized protein LOC118113388 n=1 Tax=Hippoglossus stenolepis TaxID=195615 RepID=UPI001FAE97D3|nr:uncharacterized protein LOC118113388 [Hippoglossus stenolepis]